MARPPSGGSGPYSEGSQSRTRTCQKERSRSYRREERDGRHVLFLTEARPGAYEIYQVTGANREFVESVPADGLVEVIKFAQAKAGDQNLWLEKLADQGPAVLLPKAK